MRPETRDHLALVGKSVLVAIGLVLVASAAVDVAVDGWAPASGITLLVGLLFMGFPLASAFSQAVRAARRGER